MTITAKQVAERVRKALKQAAASGGLVWSDGREMAIPPGLGFSVRATKTGVNITIEDCGLVNTITAGDREKISDFRPEMAAIVAEVDKIRDSYSPRLPGETKWGPIFISARVTGTSQIQGATA